MSTSYKVFFSDIGGVILSNGWGYASRLAAAKKYNLDFNEMEAQHHFIFNVYEMGKISFEEYLDTVIFNHPRDFSREEMKEFIFSQSVLLPDMLPWMIDLKNKHPHLKVISINNEARELNQYRINQFKLHDFFDAFVSSCEVGMRKPDPGIFSLALGIAQVKPEECIYLDDRKMLAEAACKAGIHGFHHQSFEGTKKVIEELLG